MMQGLTGQAGNTGGQGLPFGGLGSLFGDPLPAGFAQTEPGPGQPPVDPFLPLSQGPGLSPGAMNGLHSPEDICPQINDQPHSSILIT